MNLILASIGVFLGIILLLVVILLVAKQYLTPSGKVKITINGEKELEVEQGSTLLNTLSVNGIYLSSACGGKGSCGQCKCHVCKRVLYTTRCSVSDSISYRICFDEKMAGKLYRTNSNQCMDISGYI